MEVSMSAYQKRVYLTAMACLLLGSVYPMIMGISVLRDLFAFGAGFFLSPFDGFPLAPADLSVILLSACLALAVTAAFMKKEIPGEPGYHM